MLQLRYDAPQARFRQIGIWEIASRVTDLYCRDGADVHANRGETSLLMHAAPNMVRPGSAFDVEDVTPGRICSYDMTRTTPTGVVGRPTEATGEDGKLMAETLVDDFTAFLNAARIEDWPQVPPGPTGLD